MSASGDTAPLGTPHGKGFYVAIGFVALVVAGGFGYGTIAAPTNLQRFAEALIAIIFLAGALEALDRLMRPGVTHNRSIQLSASGRARLRTTRNVLVRTAWVLFFVGILLHLSNSDAVSGAGTDMQVGAAVLWFAAWCVADYSGDQLGAFSRRLV